MLSVPRRELFPTVNGVHLGDLNRIELQGALRLWASLAAAMRIVEAELDGAISWSLIGHDSTLLDSLASTARDAGNEASIWPPSIFVSAAKSISRAFLKNPRRGAAAAEIDDLPPMPEADALLVSWTRPMDEMFAVTAAHLAAMDVKRPLRTHFGPSAARSGFGSGEARRESLVVLSTPESYESDTPIAAPRETGAGDALPSPWGSLSENLLRHELARLKSMYPKQVGFISTAADIVARVKPRSVVVGNDRWWVGQIFVHLARIRGIASLCVQDGVANDMPQWRWFTADRIAVNGEHLAKLIGGGTLPSRVIKTGQPRCDALARLTASGTAESLRERLGLPRERLLVLFPTQYGQEPEFVTQVVEMCLQVNSVHLMLRAHPSEPRDLHERLQTRYQQRLSLHSEEPIEHLVASCDVVVVQGSTTALEAAALGRIVIALPSSGHTTLDHMSALDLVWVNHLHDLPLALNRCITDEGCVTSDQLATVEHFLGPLDGQSASRVAQSILDLTSTDIEVPLAFR